MVAAANLVEVAALVGDTARATALAALMGGQALTTSELAAIAGVAKSTMSEHLGRLERAGLVTSTVHRQFKYYRIASPRVAAMMESITVVAAIDCPPRYQPKSAKDDALRAARICYDHFAGRFGVALSEALVARDFITLSRFWRRGHAIRPGVLSRSGHRLGRGWIKARVLPPVSRLERTAISCCRYRWRQLVPDRIRARMGGAPLGYAWNNDHPVWPARLP